MDIIVASNNKNKIKEIKNILANLNLNIKSMEEVGFTEEIVETGITFKENAYIKAKKIFDIYHTCVLADDSGLEVEALNNEPGVFSHRYAGNDCNDENNNKKLLANLIGKKNRNADFVTCMCFINKDGVVYYTNGYINGRITKTAKGCNGFGYDPYFYVYEYNKNMAELSLEEKNKISHRAKALNKMKDIINENANNL